MTTIERIKDLISHGETEKALALLMEYARQKGGNAEQQALLLSGQYKQWKRSNIVGVEQSKDDLRRIEFGILQALESQGATSYSAMSVPMTSQKKKSVFPIIAMVVGVLGVCIAAWVVMNNNSSDQAYTPPAENGNEQQEVIPTDPVDNTTEITTPINEPSTTKKFEYKTVDLAGLTWMSENLNEDTPNSLCYADDSYNCTQQGRLYTWASARKACASLGDGWRLPTGNDWKKLTRMYGGAYGDLSNDGKLAYQQLGRGGSTGFNGAFGGKRIYFPDQQAFYYYDFDAIGYYWADEARADNPAQARMVTFRSTDNMVLYESIPNTDFISCRCVK